MEWIGCTVCEIFENCYFLLPPLHLAPPLGVKPSDLRNDLWCRKTRMLGLSDGERISMIRSAVLTQYTRVTDRRTDGQTELAWHIRAIAYMLSRVKTTHRREGRLENATSHPLRCGRVTNRDFSTYDNVKLGAEPTKSDRSSTAKIYRVTTTTILLRLLPVT